MSEYRKEVVATQKGYYGGQIQNPGDHFVILEEKAFSDKWMREPEPGEGKISDRERLNAAAAHAGAVGIAGQTVEFEGKVMTRDDVVDQAVIGPTDNGNPKPSKRAAGKVEEPTKHIISQGMMVEVPANSEPAPDPVKDDTGRFAPGPDDAFTAIARPASSTPKPSKRAAPAVAGKKND